MTVTMGPGASSGCTKAYPIASDAPTTSPSHGDTSSVHGQSPRVRRRRATPRCSLYIADFVVSKHRINKTVTDLDCNKKVR